MAAAALEQSTCPAVQVRGVRKSYGSVHALERVDLELEEGNFVALLGPSGCGKTTLLRMLAGLEKASEGEILIEGVPVGQARARHEIGVAFQRAALVPSRTALENVGLTLEVCGRGGALDPADMLREFGLGSFLNHYPHQLSGGMQQRVNIACALVHRPRLVLLDEPFGALDELTRESMGAWLSRILAGTNQTCVLVTHSVEEAVALADRVLVFSGRPGRIKAQLDITLPRPKPTRADFHFSREVERLRKALYEAVGETGVEA